MFCIPFTASYETGAFTYGLTVPWIRVSGPGNIVPGGFGGSGAGGGDGGIGALDAQAIVEKALVNLLIAAHVLALLILPVVEQVQVQQEQLNLA